MIVVELSPLEAKAHAMTQGMEESEMLGSITLDFMVQFSLSPALAEKRAKEFVTAAKSARRKIAEATRYEIRVVGAS